MTELSQRLLAQSDLSSSMQEAAGLVARSLDLGHVGILEFLPNDDHLRLRAGVGWRADLIGNATINATSGSSIAAMLASDQPVVIADLATDQRFGGSSFLLESGLVSGLIVRIPGRPRPFGLLGAFTSTRHSFTRDDGDFLQAAANVLAMALDRHRAQEECARAATIARDVSAQKQAERERLDLLARERRARADAERLAVERVSVLGQIADAVIITDPDGEITFANEAARRLLGVTRVRQPGQPGAGPADTYQLLTLDGKPFPAEELPLSRAIQSGEAIIDAALRIRRPSGSEIIIQGSATPVVAEDGTRLGGVFTFRDVTAQRLFEQRKNEFIGTVSHELRTPLTVIKGQAQLLARELEPAYVSARTTILPRLEKIDRTATTMTALINQLIDVTRSQIGEAAPVALLLTGEPRQLSREFVAVGSVARALVQELEPERVADVIADQARHFFGAAAGVWLADLTHQELHLLALRTDREVSAATLKELQTIPFSAPTFSAQAARTGQPVEVRDIFAVGPVLAMGRQTETREGFRAAFSQPLFARGRLVGVLTISYATPHSFVPEEREVIRALGDLGALAIDNARLYREAQEATRRATESAALLDTLLETAPIGFGFLDRDLRYARMNRALANLFGGPAEQYLGRTIMEVIPRLAAVIESKVRHVLTTGESELNWEVTSRQVPILPEESGWLVSYYPVRTSDGSLLGVGTVVVDITERRRVELALRRSEESLKRAQQIGHLGSWERDLTTDRSRWSKETHSIFGIRPEAYDGTYAAFLSLVHPDDRARVQQTLARALSRNIPYRVDHRIVRPDGEVRVVHEEADVVRNAAGEPVYLFGTVQDVTEQKRLEEKLTKLLAREKAALANAEAERAWLSAVLDQMPEGVVLYDARGRRRFCNRAYLALSVGETGQVDSYGNPILLDTRLPSGEPMPVTDVPTIRAIERGEIVRGVEANLRQRSGQLVAIRGNAAPICGPHGERLGTVGVFQDISALKALEREREEWVSIIGHDLRQPVTIVLGYAELLARKLAQRASPEESKAIEFILAATQNLNKMIGDLLDVSRIETRRLTIAPRRIDLELLVRDVVERATGLTPGQSVRVDVCGAVPPVEADPARIEQVLGNLLSNAVKYGYPGSEIQVVVQPRPDAVEVAVTNHGAGIPADDLPQLFSRFKRARQATAQQIPGLGLGLYISKGLVEAHGGHIWVESIVNQVTTFHFTLPLQREKRD